MDSMDSIKVDLDVAEYHSSFDLLKTGLSERGMNIGEIADFELECLRECLLFVQPLWCDCKPHSVCMAMLISALLFWRLRATCCEPVDVPRCEDFLWYDKRSFIDSAFTKLHKFRPTRAMLERKMDEINASLKLLELMKTCNISGKLGSSIVGCHALLSDSLNHIDAYVRSFL